MAVAPELNLWNQVIAITVQFQDSEHGLGSFWCWTLYTCIWKTIPILKRTVWHQLHSFYCFLLSVSHIPTERWVFGTKDRGCTGSLQLERPRSTHKWAFTDKNRCSWQVVLHRTYLKAMAGGCAVQLEKSSRWLRWCCWGWNHPLLSRVGHLCESLFFFFSPVLNLETPCPKPKYVSAHREQCWLNTVQALVSAGLVFRCLPEILTQKKKPSLPSRSAAAALDSDLCDVVKCVLHERLFFLSTDMCKALFL